MMLPVLAGHVLVAMARWVITMRRGATSARAVVFHALEALDDGGTPPTVCGFALDVVTSRGFGRGGGRRSLIGSSNHQLAACGPEQFHVDVGDALNEAVPDLDDLEVNFDEVQFLPVGLLLLYDGPDGQAIAQGSEQRMGLVRMLGDGLGKVDDLRGAQRGVPRGGLGIEFEIVDK